MRVKDIGEIGLIRRFAKKIRVDKSVIKGSGDDAAVIAWTKNKHLLFTCDMLIEDIHFESKKATPFQVGHKALARNVSDIAAMGGFPRYAVVSMGIDPDLPVSTADGILEGMLELTDRYKINIVGGDVARSEKIVIDVSLIGEVEKENLVLRSGAETGDLIFMTGAVGGSQKGRHLDFTPRLDEARELVNNFKINSMIDISDGLVIDLWRILSASQAGGRIHEASVPLSKNAGLFKKAVSEGEDFELLFTMSAKESKRFSETKRMKLKTPVTLIGEVTDKREGYKLIRKNGREENLEPRGYLHF